MIRIHCCNFSDLYFVNIVENKLFAAHYLFWWVMLFYCHVSLIIFICLLIEIIFFCKPTDVYKKDKNLKKTPLWLIGLSCFRQVSFSRKIASQTYEISSDHEVKLVCITVKIAYRYSFWEKSSVARIFWQLLRKNLSLTKLPHLVKKWIKIILACVKGPSAHTWEL